jgi:hypothetical protein
MFWGLRTRCATCQYAYPHLSLACPQGKGTTSLSPFSPNGPDVAARRSSVLSPCVALLESDFWAILLGAPAPSRPPSSFPRSRAPLIMESSHILVTRIPQQVLQVKASLLCDPISTNPAVPLSTVYYVLRTQLIAPLPIPPPMMGTWIDSSGLSSCPLFIMSRWSHRNSVEPPALGSLATPATSTLGPTMRAGSD